MTALLVRNMLRYCAWLVYPAIGIPLVFVVVGSALHGAGELDRSVWEGADTAATRVFPFILGVIATPIHLPMLVAHGVTRHRFATAAGVMGALFATAAGIYLAAGFLVEQAVYGVLDLPQRINTSHLYDSAGQPYLVLLEVALLAMAYLLGGWLVGTGYYGYGGWWGTGLLLPGALGVAAVEYVLGTGWVAGALSVLDRAPPDLPLPVAVGLALAVIAAGLAAGRTLVRPVAIRTRRLP